MAEWSHPVAGVALGHRGEPLSSRELEVLSLTASGCTTAEIAARAGVTRADVLVACRRIYEKLGVGDRTSAIAESLRLGLIS
jgi:DNA-binding CsgD family transcriptional regulator